MGSRTTTRLWKLVMLEAMAAAPQHLSKDPKPILLHCAHLRPPCVGQPLFLDASLWLLDQNFTCTWP